MEDLWVAGFPVMMALNRERRPTLNFLTWTQRAVKNAGLHADWIPAGYFVTARIILISLYDQQPLVDKKKKDEQVYGAGQSAYSRFISAGFNLMDSLYFLSPYMGLMYKKNSSTFKTEEKISQGLFDKIIMSMDIATPDTLGFITSPVFGPAAAWKQVKWRGASL